MVERSPLPRLHDIIEAIERAQEVCRDRTSVEVAENWRDRLAIERCLEIISEASRHLPDSVRSRYPAIEWRKVAGIGNILRHDYQRVSMSILWDVIVNHLPSLHRVCTQELKVARDD
jgi:uncharacterized protein with HEPN domain